MSLLPHGWINAAPSLERIGELLDEWPARALWITAVRTSDARRVVFGRDDVDVGLGRAIAALFSRRLRWECAQLERAGIEVHIFEPDGAALDAMGINALDRARSPRVQGRAFLAAGAHIADNEPLRKRLHACHAVA